LLGFDPQRIDQAQLVTESRPRFAGPIPPKDRTRPAK
jgi:hypothetical protein